MDVGSCSVPFNAQHLAPSILSPYSVAPSTHRERDMKARFRTLISVLGLAACASSGASRPAPSGNGTHWSGSFRGTNSASSAVMAPATPNRGAGTINLTALGGTPAQTRVEVTISGATPNMQLGWAVFGGACGSPAPIVAGQNQFPAISVSNSGDGHIQADISFSLDPRSSYHANVYFGSRANDMNDVMMCANLTPQ